MAYMTDENGNYKRTVRCGYCWEKGHNKSSCPKRKQDLKNNIERYKQELADSTAPADDMQRMRTEGYLRHSEQELHKMENRGKGRKCGYCGEKGHTRRTCVHRKNKVAEELSKILDVRKRAAERMMDHGFGPGALISVDSPSEHGQSVMAIVTKVDFNRIESRHVVSKDEYFYGTDCVLYNYVVPQQDTWSNTPKVTGYCYVPLEYLNIDDIHENEWYRTPSNRSCTLLSPVDVSEDSLLTEDSFGDKKKVENWVIRNIVDPR
tara:strand:+ start:586 stop:1374 length:789 start_codon:yes stop_codon:yes gene_type:complete